MLKTCFTHLPGIGPALDAKLRASGVCCWEDALTRPLPCGPARTRSIINGVMESMRRLADGDAQWFGNTLAPAQQWRLFPHFRGSAAYVDIETTGLSWPDAAITTIALFDGGTVRTYVAGDNLESFADDILAYKLLVTWNGRSFDAPFLRRSLNIPLDKGPMAHLDLLPVFRAMGLTGGLKAVERQLGLGRDLLDDVDGFAAVLLWREYEQTGDEQALETLLAYNVADVLSLESLAEYALARLGGPAPVSALTPTPVKNRLNPHRAHPAVLRRVLGLHGDSPFGR